MPFETLLECRHYILQANLRERELSLVRMRPIIQECMHHDLALCTQISTASNVFPGFEQLQLWFQEFQQWHPMPQSRNMQRCQPVYSFFKNVRKWQASWCVYIYVCMCVWRVFIKFLERKAKHITLNGVIKIWVMMEKGTFVNEVVTLLYFCAYFYFLLNFDAIHLWTRKVGYKPTKECMVVWILFSIFTIKPRSKILLYYLTNHYTSFIIKVPNTSLSIREARFVSDKSKGKSMEHWCVCIGISFFFFFVFFLTTVILFTLIIRKLNMTLCFTVHQEFTSSTAFMNFYFWKNYLFNVGFRPTKVIYHQCLLRNIWSRPSLNIRDLCWSQWPTEYWYINNEIKN